MVGPDGIVGRRICLEVYFGWQTLDIAPCTLAVWERIHLLSKRNIAVVWLALCFSSRLSNFGVLSWSVAVHDSHPWGQLRRWRRLLHRSPRQGAFPILHTTDIVHQLACSSFHFDIWLWRVHTVLIKHEGPTRNTSCLGVHQPFQALVVTPHKEVFSEYVVPKCCEVPYYSQSFFFSWGPFGFTLGEFTRCILPFWDDIELNIFTMPRICSLHGCNSLHFFNLEKRDKFQIISTLL